MKKKKTFKSGTSIPVKNKNGIIELVRVETILALGLQKILGIDKINTIKNTLSK